MNEPNELIDLIEPFPEENYPMLWGWLNEDWEKNFGDVGPKTVEELALDIRKRYHFGHRLVQVVANEQPIGVIGYQSIDLHTGIFRGICFTRNAHGTGVPLQAVTEFLKSIFRTNVTAVYAQYFASNGRVDNFLQKLGAVHLNRTSVGSTRAGESVDEVVISHQAFACATSPQWNSSSADLRTHSKFAR